MDETSTSSEESSTPASVPEPEEPTTANTTKFEYGTEAELLGEMKTLLSDPENLDQAANYLYQSIVDETILGIAFELHRAYANGSSEAMDGQPEDAKSFNIAELPDLDVFGNTAKKPIDCICNCPNCERLVAASKFAPHLEKCMGMGRNSSRIASRRIANAREGNSSYCNATNPSDDEDDADWSGEKRRKKMQNIRANGVKKNGKSGS